MKIARKREAGEVLGRKGLAEDVIRLCETVASEQSYKKAMEAAGEIKVLCEAATYDGYWGEQVSRGESKREETIEYMLQTLKAGGSKTVPY